MTTSPRLRPMRFRLLSAALAAGALSAALPATAPAQTGVVSAMSCLAQTDAAGIDAMLARAGSPLAGEGATFVAEGTAAGIDPRALVAIAAHETILATYVPSQAIHNPFGLGPGIAFASDADAIARAARTLGAYYLAEGRTTLSSIGAKWAPIGVANDPTNLNANWTAGVGSYYAALGGDPERPVLASAQSGRPRLPRGARPLPPGLRRHPGRRTARGDRVGRGAPCNDRHGGARRRRPRDRRARRHRGLRLPPRPRRRRARGLPRLVRRARPHRVRRGPPPVRGDDRQRPRRGRRRHGRRHPARRHPGRVRSAASPSGSRRAGATASATARSRPTPPASGTGAAVAPGTRLGGTAGWLRIAWDRGGAPLNPYPLLAATRPPNG